jgi:phospholipid/cholesterol/gamma-HCH transport system substrate-binding protein
MLDEGDGVPLSGDAVTLVGEEPSDWMNDVARIAKNLRELTDKLEIEGIVTNLEAASESVKNVLAKIENGEGLVGKLVSSNDNVYDDIKESVANIRSETGMLNRTNLYENLDATIANAREISEKLNRQKLFDELDGAIADFRKMCGSIDAAAGRFDLGKLDFKATTDKANDLLDNLNEVALRLKRGEGTLGKLSADDTLYKEVEGLVRDIRQTVDNYRDTTPISTFSSLATGAF